MRKRYDVVVTVMRQAIDFKTKDGFIWSLRDELLPAQK